MKCVSVVFALASSVVLGAQPAPGPTFKSNADAVTLDVRVVDREGQFVGDLTRDDLKIFEDGREQAITAFERVSIPVKSDEPVQKDDIGPAARPPAVLPDVASNDGPAPSAGTGRLYILLLDDLHTNPDRASDVRAQAGEFVTRRMTSSDRAVVLSTSGRVKGTPQFTNSRARLLDAIDQFRGDAAFAQRAMCEAQANNPGQCLSGDDRAALQSLTAVSNWLAPIAGQRKALLLFSQGLSFDQVTYMLGPDPTGASAPVGDDSSGDPHFTSGGVRLETKLETATASYNAALPFIQAAEGAAARANVTVYPLDPRQHPESLFPRIVDDTSSYYLLGFVPTNTKHDGTFRRLDVRVTRPGLKVQARKGYTAKDDRPAKSPAPDETSLLTQLMGTPMENLGLAMAVSAPSFAGSAAKSSVEVIVDVAGRELTAPSAASAGKGSLELLLTLTDLNGRVQASERGSLAMNLTDPTRNVVAQHGVRVMSRLDAAPGKYLLRVAGIGGDGSAKGSVQYDVDVPDFSKAALAMSGLALSAASDVERPTTGSDKAWNERFLQAPTALRGFSADDRLFVSGEIYRNDLRIGDVDVTTTVRNPAGEIVFQRDVTLDEGRATLRYQAAVPLQDLEEGDYVLVVEASGSDATAKTSRQIPFTVR